MGVPVGGFSLEDFADCMSVGPSLGEVGYLGDIDDLREYPCNCIHCRGESDDEESPMPETKAYIGAKIIRAFRQRHEDGSDGYTVIYPDGYESWSPKATFEAAYREVSEGEKGLLR